jgi:predicted membrane protein
LGFGLLLAHGFETQLLFAPLFKLERKLQSLLLFFLLLGGLAGQFEARSLLVFANLIFFQGFFTLLAQLQGQLAGLAFR